MDITKKEGKVKPVYLTKRLLVRLSTKAFRKAAENCMEVMGYLVIEEDGWIIKKFKDGSIEKMHELEKPDISYPLVFD